MNIAILIDCWHFKPKTFVDRFLLTIAGSFLRNKMVHWRINKFLNSRPDISTIIIASYDNRETDPVILKIQKPQVEMLLIQELEVFLKQNPCVENIFILGSDWDQCVRVRPLGYLEVHALIKKLKFKTNILVKYDCVKNTDGSVFDIEKNKDWYITNDPGVFIYKP